MSVENLSLINAETTENLEPIVDRRHLARPYPGKNYDLLVVNVNSTFQQGLIPDGEELPWGLLRVVAAARALYGLNAGILDSHRLRLTPVELSRQFQLIKPKIIGFNPTSVNVSETKVVANICDQLEIPYILGGVHATLDPSVAIRDFPSALAVVRGNGEGIVGNLIHGILQGKKIPLQGVYYQEDQAVISSDFAPKLDPDKIPVVDQRSLVEEPVYKHTVKINGMSVQIREATLYLSQGCPFDCTFCASPVMNQKGIDSVKSYTRPSNDRIVTEIESCVKDLGADADTFFR